MDFPGLIDFLVQQPLLALAIASIFVAALGGVLRGASPALGGLVRGLGNLGLVAALLLTIAQVTRFTTGNDLALPQIGMPAQSVEGGKTACRWIATDTSGCAPASMGWSAAS